MPIIANAKKALRRDRHRTAFNRVTKLKLKTAIRTFEQTPDPQSLSAAYQAIDRSVKKNLIHKNKAAHLKSAMSKRLEIKPVKKPSSKTKSSPKKT